ncbi:oxidoreductase [Xylanimonas allomyrinae]|uniref:Oxidoreductase n=1 Tax=Xylanimonas allomyrinae TaxID=2509459 RepID=A0A4P6EKH3_9MICO|nr:Gfo/Idh/MocA family oxidoreductase [Xylanimonas allomyrinae]QAY63122.1 oxidoreductase [Xylanimonas allomyrinae]
MNSSVRVGLIGAGRAGRIHGRAIAADVVGAELVAVCDASHEVAEQSARELGADLWATDYQRLLEAPEVDAVVVVTPTRLHRDIVVEAAARGKHVLCEKPMAITVAECEEMNAAAAAAGVRLQIGFMRRFDASFRRAKEAIESGAIGDVVVVKSHTRGPSVPHEWMYDLRASNGPLAEVSSHDIDTLRWLTGSEAVTLQAFAGNFRSEAARSEYPDFYDAVLMNVQLRSGALGNIEGQQGVRYGYDAHVDVVGTHGSVQVGSLRGNSTVVSTADAGMRADIVPSWRDLFQQAYVAQDQSFIDAIRAERDPEVTGEDGLRAVAMVAAGNESIRTGRRVALDAQED